MQCFTNASLQLTGLLFGAGERDGEGVEEMGGLRCELLPLWLCKRESDAHVVLEYSTRL